MKFLMVKNWEKYQHYKDRNPPWIKLHRELLHNYEFTCLQDASKLQLMLIWLLASQMDNKIPADEEWLKKTLHVNSEIDIKELIKHGFIECDSDVLADCKQVDIVETETETETETDNSSGKPECMEKDWTPNETNIKWMMDSGLSESDQKTIIRDFVDFWILSKTKRKNWNLTFRRNPIVNRKINTKPNKTNGGSYDGYGETI